MSTNQPERPARSRPRPAADAGVEPIDYRPAQPAAAPTAPAPERPATASRQAPSMAPSPVLGGVEATVQLATRVSPEVNDVLTQASIRTGRKKRSLIEEAIMRTWAT